MNSSFLDPVLSWLLYLHPLLGIVIIAFSISLMVTIAYKLLTNQSLMKDLREEQKRFQEEIKKLKNHPEKAMKVQQEMMETNMKYMTHSFKPTLFTFLPIIIIFSWLNAHMTYYPLYPGVPFEVMAEMSKDAPSPVTLILPQGLQFVKSTADAEIINRQATWYVKGNAGEYDLQFEDSGGQYNYTKKILITKERRYYPPIDKIKGSAFTQIIIGNEKVKPFEGIPVLDGIGWLGTYIIFSVIFSMTLRKVMKIY